MASNCTDNEFGPWAGVSCRGGFDFTLLFEQSIMTLVPTALFVSFSLLRLFVLAKSKTTTFHNPFRIAKLVSATIFVTLQLVLLVLQARLSDLKTKVSVVFAAINLIASIHILVLSWAEDSRSVRPSSLLNVYLLFSLLFDVPQTRTLWLQQGHSSLAAVFTASIVAKMVLLVLESVNKKRYLQTEYRGLPPESLSGILNRSLLWWLNNLFARGYRALLPFDALYVLDTDITSDVLAEKIEKAWGRRKIPERRFEYPWAVSRAIWWPILQFVIPRIFLVGFTFAQPFLITSALDSLVRSPTKIDRNKDYGLIGATALIYVGLALSTLLFEHKLYRAITMFRGATVLMIHKHTLEIQDGLYDPSAAITLMSTDTDRVIVALETLNECWARAIELGVGIYLLARQLGWPCIMPLVVVLISFIGSTFISNRIGGNQKKWVDAVQKRLALTSSVLAGMKSVKMMGLSRIFKSLIQDQRIRETNLMASFRKDIVWMNVAANLPDIWGPALTFAVYAIQASVRGSESIGTTQAFTSLAIIGLISKPAAIILSSVVNIAASIGCFDRIQQFLVSPTLEDQRLRIPNATNMSEITTSVSTDVELELIRPGLHRKVIDDIVVQMEDACIRPALSAEVLLRGIGFRIARGTFTMILGPVGSGKTTLLKAILGELSCDTGLINISSQRTAYCSQTTWLPNTTIRLAICGPGDTAKVDERWYESVLKACALHSDLAILPAGDQTIIGTGSTTLSGGQKQRVALARAIFCRPDLAIQDDTLSALDSQTKHHVVENLFGRDGLFKKLGTTIMFVTHDADLLHYADQTLVLSRVNVENQRAYTQLSCHGSSKTLEVLEAIPDPKESKPDGPSLMINTNETVSLPVKKAEVVDFTRATGEYATYKYYLKTIGLWKAILFVSFSACYAFLVHFSGIWLKWWTDVHGGQVGLYISIYFLLSVLSCIGLWGYVWSILCLISPSTSRKLHYILLETVMRAPQEFFSSTDNGVILNRFSQDMTLIESQLPVGVLITVSNFFMALGAAALVLTGSKFMAIIMPFLFAALWCLQHVYLRTSRQLRLLDLEAKSPLYSHFLESIKGIVTIRAFGWQKEDSAENHRLLDLSQRPYYLLFCIQRWLNLVLDLIVAVVAILLIALAVGLQTNISPGLLGVSMNSILSFNGIMSSLISGYTQLETSLGSVARVRDFEQEVIIEAKEGEDHEPPLNWPDRGCIEFRNVTVSHSIDNVALRNISLKIGSGKRVGICGRTGSGKSSLIGAILRLLEVNSGTILIDGIDLVTISRETIRERLVVIPQDPLILFGSLRMNIDPSNIQPDSALQAVLERVGLWDLLCERGGLDAELSASGLSLGQQQLFALARAMLKKGKILLLDEPTSNVDSKTDAIIQRVLAEEFGDCTILTVAHRLETIMTSDIIAVLDAGKLVEVGTPTTLLSQKDGWFATLARS